MPVGHCFFFGMDEINFFSVKIELSKFSFSAYVLSVLLPYIAFSCAVNNFHCNCKSC